MNPRLLMGLAWILTKASMLPAAAEGHAAEQASDDRLLQGASTLSVLGGIHYGFEAFGGEQTHDIAVVSFSYGRVITPVLASGHFWRGNLELRGEVFAGAQFSPESNWIAGLTPHFRYNFESGTQFTPFLDAGAGLTTTGIGPPDLSSTFEFNLQTAIGMHYFFNDRMALTGEVRFMHVSCAGMSQPNLGVNGVIGLLGVTWRF